jgi:hypothetical protein
MKRVKVFPESSLSIEMHDYKLNSIFVTGRADWALGYNLGADDGTLLVAMEKRRNEFSTGEPQLLTYLAILREQRIRLRKTNVMTQGFYSDGRRFQFICITADGIINKSPIYEIAVETGLKMVLNFMVTMMDTAIQSTVNASPTKPGELQEKEIQNFEGDAWEEAYKLMDACVAMCLDDPEVMENIFEMPGNGV